MKSLIIFCIHVVDLVLVSNCKNNDVVFKEVEIVTFERLKAHQAVERNISSGNMAIYEPLLNVVVGVILIHTHQRDLVFFFFSFLIIFIIIFYIGVLRAFSNV